MEKFDITIFPTTPTLQTIRGGDSFIMWRFYQVGIRNPARLSRLNKCRMFLHAISVADICNAAGTQVLADAWTGKRATGRRKMSWPRQPPAKALGWIHWQAALTEAYGLSRFQKLSNPLGDWLNESILDAWYYSPSTDRLIKQGDDGEWKAHSHINHGRGNSKFDVNPVQTGYLNLATQHGTLYMADVVQTERNNSQITTLEISYQAAAPPFPI